MAETYTLDHGTCVHHKGGRILAELWFGEMTSTQDPVRVTMTPGQAMKLVEQLSASARMALTESMK